MDAAFCPECGSKLAVVCARCGTENAPDHNFCKKCGQSLGRRAPGSSARAAKPGDSESSTPQHLAEKILTSRSALEGERKQVTVLFADLKGSMALLADRDPEEARGLLDPALERMIEAVHRYEGMVNQVMGDGIMALFGAPLANEDHAVRACYAALDMQAAMQRYAEDARRTYGVDVQIRIGLNSGEVVVRAIGSDLHMDYTAVGQTTHLAARMEQLAKPGTTLLTADTLQLAEGYIEVEALGSVPVKGLDTLVEVYQLLRPGARRSRLHDAAGQRLTRFVGREAEIEQFRQALGRAAAGHGQVVAIVGEPGVGKSRLVWEITHSHHVHGWRVLHASAVSYGKAAPYLPVIEVLKTYFEIVDGDDHLSVREKVTSKLLALDEALKPILVAVLALLNVPVDDAEWEILDSGQRRRRILDAVRILLLRESRVQPLLVVFEDLHWIDGETPALLNGLVESLPTARVVLVVNYRPEYHHSWSSKTYYTQLGLKPLSASTAEALLETLLGEDAGLEPVKRLLIARTEGNPFFLEESVRALVETKVLAGDREAYRLVKPVQTIQMPATVQAVVAARIDRLPAEEKRLLQAASVVGKDVPVALLTAIAEMPAEELWRGLTHLQGTEFLYETALLPEAEYTFKHAVTHEVAYASLLHARRRTLHATLGRVIEDRHPEDKPYALLAHHFRAAGELERALSYYTHAAEAARRAYAVNEALNHYDAALDAADRVGLTADQPIVTELRLKRGQVCAQSGDMRGAERDFKAALDGARVSGDRTTEMRALNELGFLLAGADYDAARPHLESALRLADALGDGLAQTTILSRLSIICSNQLRLDRALEHAQQALTLARTLTDPRASAVAMDSVVLAAGIIGDSSTVDDLMPQLIATHRNLGNLWYLQFAFAQWSFTFIGRGRWAQAHGNIEESVAVNRRIGDRGNAPMCPSLRCWIHRSRGEYGDAIRAGREAVALAQEIAHPEWTAWSEAHLGWTLQDIYAVPDAAEHLQQGLNAALRGGASNHTLTCAARLAWSHFDLGDTERALASAAQAEAIMKAMTAPPGRTFVVGAHAYMAVARLHAALGDVDRALAFLEPTLAALDACGWREAAAEAALVVAECRATRGDVDGANTVLRRALEDAQVVGLPAIAWRAHLALAKLSSGRRSDRADDHRAQAAAIVDRLAASLDATTMREPFRRAVSAEFAGTEYLQS